MNASQECEELLTRKTCLPEDRAERAWASSRCMGTMATRSALRILTWLPRWLSRPKGAFGQGSYDLGSGYDRDRGAHAESLEGGDDGSLEALGWGLVLEAQLERLAQAGESLLHRGALAFHLDLEAAGDVPVALMPDRCREPHDDQPTPPEFAPRKVWRRCDAKIQVGDSAHPASFNTKLAPLIL